MNELIIILDKLMDVILSKLECLNFDNFDSTFPNIVAMAKDSQNLQKVLIEKHGEKRVLDINPGLEIKAKQIKNKFDNIVRIFSEEEKRLEKELKSFEGQKKLMNYKRYEYANQRTI